MQLVIYGNHSINIIFEVYVVTFAFVMMMIDNHSCHEMQRFLRFATQKVNIILLFLRYWRAMVGTETFIIRNNYIMK